MPSRQGFALPGKLSSMDKEKTFKTFEKNKVPKETHISKLAKYRDISAYQISKMSEEEAFLEFVKFRWGDINTAVCPGCGVVDRHYYRKNRRQWRCKHCDRYFSVTTGTPFQDRKMCFQKILYGLIKYITMPSGISFHSLAADIDVQVKTAMVFVGKIQEVMIRQQTNKVLDGLVQVDGGYFGGMPRHGRVRYLETSDIVNHVENQLIKNKKKPFTTVKANKVRENQNRRIGMVLRDIYDQPGLGGRNTMAFATDAEDFYNAKSLINKFVPNESMIWTDKSHAYLWLPKSRHRYVEHGLEFSTTDGVNDNQAESYFSRVRRNILGVCHRVQPKYFQDKLSEMAWREDVRKLTLNQKFELLIKDILRHGLSKFWTGYWQGCNRPGELIWHPIDSKLVVRRC
jgi:transposase-like protein